MKAVEVCQNEENAVIEKYGNFPMIQKPTVS